VYGTSEPLPLWKRCCDQLELELPAQKFNTWIRPLQVIETQGHIRLLAPNRFVLDWVKSHYLAAIAQQLSHLALNKDLQITLEVGSRNEPNFVGKTLSTPGQKAPLPVTAYHGNLNTAFTYDSFVEGRSNQMARAVAIQVSENPGKVHNPLCIYGATGRGKTHLMHAAGNHVRQRIPTARVIYMHSERFVQDMIKAIQHNAIREFQDHYRSANALLIDDIQFFSGKERSQDEFFHTFNNLIDARQQVILTCDRYPSDITGLEERLRSRFSSGLTVCIEPPDLETRTAIVLHKANLASVQISPAIALMISRGIPSNIRELEGALRRVIAHAEFTGGAITEDFVRDALHDIWTRPPAQEITLEAIQKGVADYFKIRRNDLLGNSRARHLARPRQLAMALAKDLSDSSYPEIGRAFGGRDHTTVMHACRKIAELRPLDPQLEEDFINLSRSLTERSH
jgi:chromosomal replication initiator protein